MTLDMIRAWFACQMPGARAAWELILLTRQGGTEYVFPFELEDTFKSSPESNFDAAYQRFLDAADLEITTENIPPFGEVEIIYINSPYIDQILVAVTDPAFTDTCAVYGFAGTPYPNA